MNLIAIVVILVLVGFAMWLINGLIPMSGPIKKILNAIITIVVILWLLAAFGIIPNILHLKLK